jgi:hypothetical protein
VTAWCEIVAMVSSFLVSVVFLLLSRNGVTIGTAQGLIITIAVTTACWILTAYLGPQTDEQTLINFYRKVRPSGPGWKPIQARAGAPAAGETGENISLSLVGWVAGSTMIWSALFTVGNFLYGRLNYAFALLAVFAISAVVVVQVVRRVWK